MTEKEAKKKWCPFSVTGAYTDRGPMTAVSVNRDPRPEVSESCLCLVSKCMAWRWSDFEMSDGYCGLTK